MRKFTKLFLITLLVGVLVSNVFGAEIRPDASELGSIRNAIVGASAGDVIILERGKVYYSQVTIDLNVDLTIKADEATEGDKPIVAPFVKEDGSTDREMMFARADLTCENIHFHAGISGRPIHDDTQRGIVFVETSNMRAVFNNCWFEDFDGRTVQLEAPDIKFFATNCIWLDDHQTTGPSVGRSLDLRQFGPDTLSLVNCSFVNNGDRWIRHLPSSGRLDEINYCVIDHCTFINNQGYRPAFDFGHLENLQFTNNIVYNPGLLGTDYMRRPSKNDGAFFLADSVDFYSTDKSLAPHRLNEVYYDRFEGITVFACHGVDSMGTEIVMTNNNLYRDPAIAAKLATNDTLSEQKWMCSQFEESIVGGVENAFMSEELAFVEAPGIPLYIIDEYIGYWDQNPLSAMFYTAPDSIDLSYGTEATAYTAAEGGYPLGDLNWYPDKKAEWESGTPVHQNTIATSQSFKLEQNYPNPFNPETVINFTIDKASDVSLTVYNLMGQKVRTLANGMKASGSHQVIWNGLNDLNEQVPAGVYFYRLDADSKTSIKRMVMMK